MRPPNRCIFFSIQTNPSIGPLNSFNQTEEEESIGALSHCVAINKWKVGRNLGSPAVACRHWSQKQIPLARNQARVDYHQYLFSLQHKAGIYHMSGGFLWQMSYREANRFQGCLIHPTDKLWPAIFHSFSFSLGCGGRWPAIMAIFYQLTGQSRWHDDSICLLYSFTIDR